MNLLWLIFVQRYKKNTIYTKKNTEKLAYIIKKQYFCIGFRFNLKGKYIINP